MSPHGGGCPFSGTWDKDIPNPDVPTRENKIFLGLQPWDHGEMQREVMLMQLQWRKSPKN